MGRDLQTGAERLRVVADATYGACGGIEVPLTRKGRIDDLAFLQLDVPEPIDAGILSVSLEGSRDRAHALRDGLRTVTADDAGGAAQEVADIARHCSGTAVSAVRLAEILEVRIRAEEQGHGR